MTNKTFVDSVVREIVAPGVEKLMQSPFFLSCGKENYPHAGFRAGQFSITFIIRRCSKALRYAW